MADEFANPVEPNEVERIRPDALGEPGQRRFRILALVGGETWIIWMEKQQLQALGLAIAQILQQAMKDVTDPGVLEDSGVFDDDSANQFRLGRVELGFDDSDDSIVIIAHDVQADDDDPGLGMRLSHVKARVFIREASALAAAGRPLCPMCGNPMDPTGHVCPEQNGHLPIRLDEGFLSD